MSKNRVLAIEDDEGVCRLLRHSLAREDYQVDVCHRGEDGLKAAIGNPPDLLLLDLELPGVDGLTVCEKLKQHPGTRSLPIIILTGKGDEADVVQGLEMGADDYIVKPFSPKILNARVHAVLRRRTRMDSSTAPDEIIQYGLLQIDTSSHCIKIEEFEIELSPPEYRFAVALVCFLSGQVNMAACEHMNLDEDPAGMIGRDGMVLYAENRLGRLLPVFEALITTGAKAPVLYAFYGLALLEKEPVLARQFLSESVREYNEANDPLGELVILSVLVFYHVFFDGDSGTAQRYLERGEVLNKAFFDRLSVYSRVAVSQNLALGRAFLLNDFKGANEYLSLAEALAEDRGLINLVVLNRLVSIFEAYVTGDQELMAEGLEDCFRFVNHPQVSFLHKTFLKLIQLRFFSLTGRFEDMFQQQKKLSGVFQDYHDEDNLATAMLFISRLERMLFDERFSEALKLSADILQRSTISRNDIARPILNGIKALSAACCQNRDIALEAVEECRSESKAPTFHSVSARLYCARALAKLGETEEAERLVYHIETLLKENAWHHLWLQARVQQVLLMSGLGRNDAGPLGDLLLQMRKRNVWYLKNLIKDDYLQICRIATEAGVEEEFARSMLRKRFAVEIAADGSPYPMLRISTLGGLEMRLGDEVIGKADGFSRTQREFLALLVAAPEHRISQEEVQLTFWPDSRPEQARSSLDTMLSRFRKTLKDKLQPYSVKNYLKLQKGVLSLEAVIVDAEEVGNQIALAREFIRRREYWQADVAFSKAFSLWDGEFMPGACSADRAAGYARELQQAIVNGLIEWSDILNDSGQVKSLLEALTHALTIDRCNESIMRALYRTHMLDGNISRANQLLQEFDVALRSEGYSASETARIVASVKTAP